MRKGMMPALSLAGFFVLALNFRQLPPESDAELLGLILKQTGEYCERLKAMAFDFVCHENTVEETTQFQKTTVYKRTEASSEWLFVTELKPRKTTKKTQVYDYQMIKKGDRKEEKCILIEDNGRKKHEENNSFGRIWIDLEDFSVLKIQWDPRSIEAFRPEVVTSVGELEREVDWSVEYGIEKNGVKFPSRQAIEERLISQTGKKHPKSAVTVVFDNYKFFTVETEVEYR